MKKRLKPIQVRFVVQRRGFDEVMYAVVKAGVNNPKLTSSYEFVTRLRQVLTDWTVETADGARVLESTGGGFNIDDLADVDQDSTGLRGRLNRAGIVNLSVELHSEAQTCNSWSFDDDLVYVGTLL